MAPHHYVMFFTLLSLFFQFHLTNSLPDGAGSCHSGSAITHGPHPISPNGQLLDKAIKVFIDDTQLVPSVPHTLNISNESSVLSVHATSSFRGFLIRGMSGNGNDVPDALMPLNEAQLERSLSYCNDYIPQASGVTHRSSNGKTNVMALIKNDQVDVLILEITIMVTPNEYYYSRFSVNVVDTAPTTQPHPYVKPSAIPSGSPSDLLSNFSLEPTVQTSSPSKTMATSYPNDQPTGSYVAPASIPTNSTSKNPTLTTSAPSNFSPESTIGKTIAPTTMAAVAPQVHTEAPTTMATDAPQVHTEAPTTIATDAPQLHTEVPTTIAADAPQVHTEAPTTMAADAPQLHTEVFPTFNKPTFPSETATLLPTSSSLRTPAFGGLSLSLLIVIMLIHIWFLRNSNECQEIQTFIWKNIFCQVDDALNDNCKDEVIFLCREVAKEA